MNDISISKKNVVKLTVKAPDLDPIGVFIEEFKTGRAKVTIEVFGDAWSFYWGSMGPYTLREFFTDIPYLVGKFCRGSPSEYDYEKVSTEIEVDVDISSVWLESVKMEKHYGHDWYMCLPSKPTQEYRYLTRIITAIVKAFEMERVAG